MSWDFPSSIQLMHHTHLANSTSYTSSLPRQLVPDMICHSKLTVTYPVLHYPTYTEPDFSETTVSCGPTHGRGTVACKTFYTGTAATNGFIGPSYCEVDNAESSISRLLHLHRAISRGHNDRRRHIYLLWSHSRAFFHGGSQSSNQRGC